MEGTWLEMRKGYVNEQGMERLYRPNVAGMMVRQDGKLLICERSGQKGAWQFPQGGIDPGETALEAVRREIGEEVGFCRPSMILWNPGRGIVTIIRWRCWSMFVKSGGSLLLGRRRSISCAGCMRTLRNPSWMTGSFAITSG